MDSPIKIVWSKEVNNIVGNARILVIYLVLVVSMPVVASYGISNAINQIPMEMMEEVLKYMANFFVLYYSIPITLIVSHSLLSEIFYREKIQGTLSTLLSAPITIEEVVIGKTLAVTTFAYPLTLFSIFVFLLTLDARYPQWSIAYMDKYALNASIYIATPNMLRNNTLHWNTHPVIQKICNNQPSLLHGSNGFDVSR